MSSKAWKLLPWLVLYAVICAAEMLISWAKEQVEEQIKGKPKDDDHEDR